MLKATRTISSTGSAEIEGRTTMSSIWAPLQQAHPAFNLEDIPFRTIIDMPTITYCSHTDISVIL